MGNVIGTMLCPSHEDRTPSLRIYDTKSGYCFVCGAAFNEWRLKKLGVDFSNIGPAQPKKKEDVTKTLDYISKLPKKEIRGLELSHDHGGYYIVYPNAPYYLKRLWVAENSDKYRGPKGWPRPLFIAHQVPSEALVLVEGELNALSIAKAFQDAVIASPGSTGHFSQAHFDAYSGFYKQFRNIFVWLDAEPKKAAEAALNSARIALNSARRHVTLFLGKDDANDILVKHGAERLKQDIKKGLEMPTGL